MHTAPQITETLSAAKSIVEDIIWATATTVSASGTPRSRLVHPVWYWHGDAPVGYVTSRPTPLRVAHIAAHPKMSLFYWSPKHDTVAIDTSARWVPTHQLLEVWNTIAATPPPVGFDPHTIWPEGPTSDDYAVLQVAAYRVMVRQGLNKLPPWRTDNDRSGIEEVGGMLTAQPATKSKLHVP
jgi:hypothetical protein